MNIIETLYELKDKDFSKLSDERLCEILSFIDKTTAEVSENE